MIWIVCDGIVFVVTLVVVKATAVATVNLLLVASLAAEDVGFSVNSSFSIVVIWAVDNIGFTVDIWLDPDVTCTTLVRFVVTAWLTGDKICIVVAFI